MRINTDPMWFDTLEQPQSLSISNNARRFSRTTLSIHNLHTKTNIDLRITELFLLFACFFKLSSNRATKMIRCRYGHGWCSKWSKKRPKCWINSCKCLNRIFRALQKIWRTNCKNGYGCLCWIKYSFATCVVGEKNWCGQPAAASFREKTWITFVCRFPSSSVARARTRFD